MSQTICRKCGLVLASALLAAVLFGLVLALTQLQPVHAGAWPAFASPGLSYAIDPAATITTVAGTGSFGYSGDGGPATAAQLGGPSGVALDGSGNLYIAGFNNDRIRKVDGLTGIITTVAGTGSAGYSGDGGPATAAQLDSPYAVALDGSGNLYIGDTWNHRIRKVDGLTGIITTVAGTGSGGYSGDGGPATAARLRYPRGMTLDGSDNIYIADESNHRVRRVDALTGIITTVAGTGSAGYSGDGGPATAAQLRSPFAVALDGAGNLYIADWSNARVRMVDAVSGIITTVAGTGSWGYAGDGGPATAAQLSAPSGVAVDGSGSLYIADTYNHRIRGVDALTGIITTVAGTGTGGYSGDGGPAGAAQLMSPAGVALDGSGNLFIADMSNHRVRQVGEPINYRPTLGTVDPSSGSGPTDVTTSFTTTWNDANGWPDLKQCYFHIGDNPSIVGSVTLLYNAAKDKLWLRSDDGTAWTGGFAPESANTLENSQAIVHCGLTTAAGSGHTLTVKWAIEFKPGYAGTKKLGLKCKDRSKAKAKGKWKGTWTIL